MIIHMQDSENEYLNCTKRVGASTLNHAVSVPCNEML